jgi:adenine-specific DNA-methyltransferase
MRFLGNKESIKLEISGLLKEKGLSHKNLIFFDAFCGSGSISDALKDSFDIVANDLLLWCTIYTRGRVCAYDCNFSKLGFNPFEYFNKSNITVEGFFYKNYSPGGSKRMYLSSFNASRIDYFRQKIEEWKKNDLLSENEYCYLLSCLIESVSAVSNTAGVYGAFLKHWDSRSVKPINFIKVNSNKAGHGKLTYINEKVEDIIGDIKCDVLYLDPPYTQNQYGTQYHLLETLVLNDNPQISKITGSRSTAPIRSDWSKNYKVNILFDKVIALTKAKYIVLSYNKNGLMSKAFIEAVLKRYGKPDTYTCKKIPYKKYGNFKTKADADHFEYLFFVEKKDSKDVHYESPLNYIGSKSKMINHIKVNLPIHISNFIDLFGGGFNVGINIKANKIKYNDINCYVKDLVESFKTNDTYDYLLYIQRITNKFGLEKAKSANYLCARQYYNSLPPERRDPILLYTIILYGYQQQIRFNGNHEFNNPVGMRWFNDRVLEKMISFSRVIKENKYTFECSDYLKIEDKIQSDDFVYMDPPYRLTTGSYNDGKRGFKNWTIRTEKELFDFSDRLDKKGIHFMLSYVIEHDSRINLEISSWIKTSGYRVIYLDTIPGRKRKEVLIVNYDKQN